MSLISQPALLQRAGPASCLFTPRACPFGGACHACPLAARAQRAPGAGGGLASAPVLAEPSVVLGGQPLPPSERAFFEPRFGHDFGQVQVYAGARAASSAEALGARTYTVGRDIVFGAGQYAPASGEGRKLLAHELTHVLQQSARPTTRAPGELQRKPDSAGQRRDPATPRRRINYRKAKQANRVYAADPDTARPDALGWAAKLAAVAGGAYRAWADLWAQGSYDEFADAVAGYQLEHGATGKSVDGILGLATWAAIAGMGEAMAGIHRVYLQRDGQMASDTCYLATEERIKRGYRQVTGRRFKLPEEASPATYDWILKSMPNHMLDVDPQYRGTGAAGALVYSGLGQFVDEADIWAGKLQPGAALQVWGSRSAYDLLRAGEIEENGKQRRITDSDADFYGTSLVFVRYDPKANQRMLVRHFGRLQWVSKGDFDVWIAANVQYSPSGPAGNSPAEVAP